MKTSERDMARKLRSEGLSVRQIETRLGVARSSVSHWVRDVELSEEQRAALALRVRFSPAREEVNRRKGAKFRALRSEYQRRGRAKAAEGDPVFVAGCMLYWAEGSKARNSAKMSNSDPEVLRFFVTFLRRYFAVPDELFSVYCNLFADHVARQREIEQFWLETLQLPQSCLRKSIVNVYSKYSQKKRQNRLPWGTTRVAVHRTEIVQTIYGAIQEVGGFDRPEWLD
jgi:hypothetical protein